MNLLIRILFVCFFFCQVIFAYTKKGDLIKLVGQDYIVLEVIKDKATPTFRLKNLDSDETFVAKFYPQNYQYLDQIKSNLEYVQGRLVKYSYLNLHPVRFDPQAIIGGQSYFVEWSAERNTLSNYLSPFLINPNLYNYPEAILDRVYFAIDVILQLDQTLNHLWERGLVLGDISPKNIIIEGAGRVRLIDFETMVKRGGYIYKHTYAFTPVDYYNESYRASSSYDLYSLGMIMADIVLSGVKVAPRWEEFIQRYSVDKTKTSLEQRQEQALAYRGEVLNFLVQLFSTEMILKHPVVASFLSNLDRMTSKNPSDRGFEFIKEIRREVAISNIFFKLNLSFCRTNNISQESTKDL